MFETIFRMAIASSPGADRRWRSLPVSLVLHGLALVAFALLSVRTLTEVPKPPIDIVFLEGSAPPLPLGERIPATSASRSEDRPVSAILLRPDEIPLTTETSPSSPDSPVPEPGNSPASDAVLGDPNGRSAGAPDGLAGSEGRQGPRPGDSERLYRPGGDVIEPRLLDRVEPTYPEAPRKLRVEGVVILQAIISAAGSIEQVQIVKSVNPLLDAEAVRAVQQWRYRPATLNGRPVRVYLTVTVEFRLR